MIILKRTRYLPLKAITLILHIDTVMLYSDARFIQSNDC